MGFSFEPGRGPIVGIQKVWNDIRTRAGLPQYACTTCAIASHHKPSTVARRCI